MQYQQTGFQPNLVPQQTGFVGNNPRPTGFMQPQATGFPQFTGTPGLLNPQQQQQQQQQNRFLSPSPALVPQQTGWQGGGLVPQMTGYTNPHMQMMNSTFMPSFSGGVPQFQQNPQAAQVLQQTLAQQNPAKISWALSKDERKNYDQLFRAWDQKGVGLIGGAAALEVFGQSGLPKDDLAKIW